MIACVLPNSDGWLCQRKTWKGELGWPSGRTMTSRHVCTGDWLAHAWMRMIWPTKSSALTVSARMGFRGAPTPIRSGSIDLSTVLYQLPTAIVGCIDARDMEHDVVVRCCLSRALLQSTESVPRTRPGA